MYYTGYSFAEKMPAGDAVLPFVFVAKAFYGRTELSSASKGSMPIMMSRTGFAEMPQIAVLPMCSICTTSARAAFKRRRFSSAKRWCQSSLCGANLTVPRSRPREGSLMDKVQNSSYRNMIIDLPHTSVWALPASTSIAERKLDNGITNHCGSLMITP